MKRRIRLRHPIVEGEFIYGMLGTLQLLPPLSAVLAWHRAAVSPLNPLLLPEKQFSNQGYWQSLCRDLADARYQWTRIGRLWPEFQRAEGGVQSLADWQKIR